MASPQALEVVVRCPHPCKRFLFGAPPDMPTLEVPIRMKCQGCKRMVLWWPNRVAAHDIPPLPDQKSR